MPYLIAAVQTALGLVFAVSGLSKLAGRRAFDGFVAELRATRLVGARARPVAAAVVAAELAVATALAVPQTRTAGLAAAAGLLAVLTAGVAVTVRRRVRATCRCFGATGSQLGAVHVVRNASLCTVAAAAAVLTPGIPPAGLPVFAVGAVAGAVLALLIIRLDDVAALFAKA
jgi:hypothetical protein